ncbi:hypothetical protein [Lentibacillus juripiscarius]|uniref:Chitin-binding type-2 domain-containing protein n=1 Tax=Lentibacillus juripiscarius TaxID=257446 RepID=A0ABW5V3W8_9BACI
MRFLIKRKIFFLLILSIITLTFAPGLNALANSYDESEHDSLQHISMNNMMKEKYENVQQMYKKDLEEAKENGEKLYTLRAIVKFPTSKLGISENEHDKLRSYVESLKNAETNEMKDMFSNKQKFKEYKKLVKKRTKHELKRLFSINSLQKAVESSSTNNDNDEVTVFGADPGTGGPVVGFDYKCNDDNGILYKNFFNSDCHQAWYVYLLCTADVTSGMFGNDRYCQLYERNCSPLIGHSIYPHSH